MISATDAGCILSTSCYQLARLSGLAIDGEGVAVARNLDTGSFIVIISRCGEFRAVGKDEVNVTVTYESSCLHIAAENYIPTRQSGGFVRNYGCRWASLLNSIGIDVIDRLCLLCPCADAEGQGDE
ncbi:MAG: hypothetical protein MJ000_04110 [Bacteroidales bacterium]|nr:hypothetical protein [Bacteroidales bacterium]